MESNNVSAGVSETPNSNNGNTMLQSEAAVEMQAAIVADQIANPTASQPQENPMTVEPAIKKKSGGKGMLIALVLFALIAAGGVGFGVWAMIDGNSQQEVLDSQIISLKKQNNDLLNQVAELNEKIDKLEKEAANNGGGNDSGSNVDAVTGVTAEVVDGVFYVKDENGTIVAQDNARTVTEIVSCDGGTATAFSPLKCVVTTSEGEGAYTYNLDDKTLNFVQLKTTDMPVE